MIIQFTPSGMLGFAADDCLFHPDTSRIGHFSGVDRILIGKCSRIFPQDHFFRYAFFSQHISHKFPLGLIRSRIVFLHRLYPCKCSFSDTVFPGRQNPGCHPFFPQPRRLYGHLRKSVSRHKEDICLLRFIFHKNKITDLI